MRVTRIYALLIYDTNLMWNRRSLTEWMERWKN